MSSFDAFRACGDQGDLLCMSCPEIVLFGAEKSRLLCCRRPLESTSFAYNILESSRTKSVKTNLYKTETTLSSLLNINSTRVLTNG